MKRPAIKIEDFWNSACAHLNKHLFAEEKPPVQAKKKSKFGNSKAEVDGIPFDSKREAKRYKELKRQLKMGVISFLARQVEFELNSPGTHSVVYTADFTYTISATGENVVEDVKGFETRTFKKKEKLMKKVHGIAIHKT